MYHVSYAVDLFAARLDESQGGTWLQAFPLGKYHHPVYGEIEITPERCARFAENVQKRVRGQDLDIDYDHKARTGEAAGWVKNAEARADGLWIFVEWTKDAYGKIKEKAYRYFSPEFRDEWEHPATKMKFQDVMFGGALTNRPFLKGILPINLSEVFDTVAAEVPQPKEGEGMDPKALRKQLGLAEDATDEQVTAKITELTKAPPAETKETEGEGGAGGGPASGSSGEQQSIAASESLTKLAEDNPAIAELLTLVNAQGAKLNEQSTELQELRVTKALGEFDTETLKLTPAAREAAKNVMLGEDPTKNLGELLKLITKGNATVQLGEISGTTAEDRRLDENSATSRYLGEIDKAMKANDKLDYATAADKVAAAQPQLYDEYRKENYSFRTVE